MKLTIAVCTYRRFKYLFNCLDALRRQTLQADDFKIIVVDNSLEPEKSIPFRDSLNGFEQIDYIITEEAGLSYARNIALAKCDTPIIAYIDDDAIAAPNWAEEIVKVFQSYPGAGAIGGKVNPIWEGKRDEWLKSTLLHHVAVLDWGDNDCFITEDMWLVGANVAYRTNALKAVNGFSKALGRTKSLLLAHEELAVNMAIKGLGYDIVYCPEIKVDHLIQNERMQKEWFCQNALWEGASRVLLEWNITSVDTDLLTERIEESYISLSQSHHLPTSTEELTKLCEIFSAQGRDLCLELLNILPDQPSSFIDALRKVIYVVTPCLNANQTIDQTIASVLTQSGDFAIRYHIQDGGSTDGTFQKIINWEKRINEKNFPLFCKNIVFTFSTEADNNMYEGLKKGFSTMSIPDIAFMTWINADDIFLPFSFHLAMNILTTFPQDVWWLGGKSSVFDGEHNLWKISANIIPSEIIENGLSDGIHWDFVQQEGSFFTGNLWKKACEHNVFEGFSFAGDWNLWRFFAKHTLYYHVPWPLATFRKHENQLSKKRWEEYKSEINSTINSKERRKIFLELVKKNNLSAPVIKEETKSQSLVIINKNARIESNFYLQRLLGTKTDSFEIENLVNTQISSGHSDEQPFLGNSNKLKLVNRETIPSRLIDPTQITFGPGWHNPKYNTDSWWCWSPRAGIIHLKTSREGNSRATLALQSMTPKNTILVKLNGQIVSTLSADLDLPSFFTSIELPVKKGTNILEFSSNNESLFTPESSDPNNFMIKDLTFTQPSGRNIFKVNINSSRTMRTLAKSGLFFPSYYSKQVAQQMKLSLELHYLLYGAWESKNPNPLFDSAFYLENNYDVYISGMNPLLHYILHGWEEGRDPHPMFSTNDYLKTYPDVVESKMNPLLHYIKHGILEGRSISPTVAS